ncbi:hypothetical protein SAMN05421771_2753 [Granulicella pectinivorans]|uniref:Uncharacterized protein n=2 Tax=Granulicella pectinivorans TaxID=474950 RepID=A0A1I6MIV6_9BACT|nr:hypothetical protein SAMN05421771_2753 [Granulicella pectinivorans]
MSRMQTLGLSSTPQPTDNLFKRLFWPSIETQYDVDLLGQQGFYVCTAVGGVSFLLLLFLGMPFVGMLTAAVYFLAACGVRERSIAASALAFALYLTGFAGGMVHGGGGNPFVGLVITMLLFSNLRATVLARRWSKQPDDETEFHPSDRSSTSVLDRLSNQLPPKIWPRGKFAFFPLVGLYLLLAVVGLMMTKRIPQPPQQPVMIERLDTRP